MSPICGPLFASLRFNMVSSTLLSISSVPQRGSSMTRAGTGEARFPILSGLSTAKYFFELAVVAVSYFGITETALLLPALNAASTPLWPPTGVALSLILLRGNRVWPAILTGSIFASAISSGPTSIFRIGFKCGRHHGRSARRSLADQSLVARSQQIRIPAQRCKIWAHLLRPDRDDQFRHRYAGPGVANALGFADPSRFRSVLGQSGGSWTRPGL